MFSIVILLCHSHSWIIKEGVVYLKNEYNFWIPRAKNVRNIKFCRSNSIISKITRPSFLQFSVLKGTLRETCQVWRHTWQEQKIQTWITHEIMEILTYSFCKHSSFLMVYPIQAKNHMIIFYACSPLRCIAVCITITVIILI